MMAWPGRGDEVRKRSKYPGGSFGTQKIRSRNLYGTFPEEGRPNHSLWLGTGSSLPGRVGHQSLDQLLRTRVKEVPQSFTIGTI